MMEGENVKSLTPNFQTTTTQGSADRPILHRVLVLPLLKLERFYPTSVPSLDFLVTFLIKQKSKSPSAASRGKPAQRKRAPITSYNCSSTSRHCCKGLVIR